VRRAVSLDCRPGDSTVTGEALGHRLFHQLWQQADRPDGLFVYPDSLARGVFYAALELGVRVPEDLRLVVHRNEEIEMFCPFPVTWITVRAKDFAVGLMRQIRLQVAGRPAPRLRVHPGVCSVSGPSDPQ